MAHFEDIEDEVGPLSDGEYEEGLDDEYTDDEYDEEGDLIDEELADTEDQGFIKGLEPLPERGAGSRERQAEHTPPPWQGLSRHAAATQAKFNELLSELRETKKTKLTLLLLGKYHTGKSSLIDIVLQENATTQHESSLQGTEPTDVYTRTAHGFTLTLVDTDGITSLDRISREGLSIVSDTIKDKPIDVVLYVDRLDFYRVTGVDVQVIKGITKHFGPEIWQNTLICFSHSQYKVNGYNWEEFATRRHETLQAAIRKHGRAARAELPVAFAETSDACAKNEEGELALPNGQAWLPAFMQQVVKLALSNEPYQYNAQKAEKHMNPGKRHQWLIPVLFAGQIALKFLVFDKLVKEDNITGDKFGPYDPNVVKAERALLALEKQSKARQAQRRRPAEALKYYDSDSD